MLRCVVALACSAGFLALLGPITSRGLADSDEGGGVRFEQHGTYPELRVGGKPFFIYAAEFFYPRVPRVLWEPSLEHYRELGINTITLTVPWNWHEPREGEFDFDGHTNPRRDLRGLLKLIAQRGFKLITRLGPATGGQWRNGGYPDWLLERPEFHMPLQERLDGSEPSASELAAAGAESAAGKWLEAGAHEFAAYRAGTTLHLPAEGQAGAKPQAVDREIDGPLLFVLAEDGREGGREDPAGAASRNHAGSYCAVLRRAGLDVPCFAHASRSAASLESPAGQQRIALMGQLFFGPGGGGADEERRLTPMNLAELEATAASLAAQPELPPMLDEFNASWFAPQDDARPLRTAHGVFRTSSHLLLGRGIHGLGWYPVQDSLTPGGYGTSEASRYYRWDAGLSLAGAREPAAREIQRVGEWLRTWGGKLAASHPRADFGVVDALGTAPLERLSAADEAAMLNGTMQLERLALYAGLTSELVNPAQQPVEQLLRHALLLFPVYRPDDPGYAPSEPVQRTLEAYVRGGGVLVCFPGRPAGAAFERMQAGDRMRVDHLPEGTGAWRAGAGQLVVLTKDFYSWVSLREEIAEGARRFEAPFARGLLEAMMKTAGMRQTIRRESTKTESAELIANELVSNEGSQPLGERNGGEAWLSAVNLSRETTINETLQVLSPQASARSEKNSNDDWIEFPVRIPPQESLLLPLELGLCLEPAAKLKCEDALISSGAELVKAEREGKTMILSFYAPAKASVRLRLAARPMHMEVDEVQANGEWTKSNHELVVELLRGASPHFLHELRMPLPYQPALPERPKTESKHLPPAHFRFTPAGAVRLPLGEDSTLLTNPPLFVFRRGDEGSIWVGAENVGGQGASVQVQASGEFNASAKSYVNANELRSLNLKLPVSILEKTADAPAADGLYHGTLHFASGAETLDLPVSYVLLPEKGAVGYEFDFDADGSAERVLENSALRAIVSPADGGRIVALVSKSPDRNLASTMGLLEDVFTFTPIPPGNPREQIRGGTGTFNRAYAADWIAGEGENGPALRMRYDAPDVYPHGARIEKVARFKDAQTVAVEYHVSLLPADARRLEEERAGRIFAAPPTDAPVSQSFAILNSVPATVGGSRTTQICWPNPEENGTEAKKAEHCEGFVPDGAAITPPGGARHVEFREAQHPGLAIEWEDAGAQLTLEPKRYSILARLAFPPLNPGGATAAYRIEFSVKGTP